jgi:hypothetical protein
MERTILEETPTLSVEFPLDTFKRLLSIHSYIVDLVQLHLEEFFENLPKINTEIGTASVNLKRHT